MPRSASKLVLAAGFAVVLALAIGLVRLTHGDAEPAPPARRALGPASAAASDPAPAGAAAATAPVAARELPSTTAPRHVAIGAAPRQPELPAAPFVLRRELKRDANGHLVPVIPLGILREQLGRTEAPMQACLAHAGQRATGKATLSFTVAPRNGKLVIETTGIEDADTLTAYPDLLDCMHRTANVLVVDDKPIPELGTPIYVRRHVQVENGQLVENTFFNFSYNP